MTERRIFDALLPFALLLAGLAAALPAAGADALSIGYLEIEDDPRYEERRRYAGIELRQRRRPVAGAEVGIRESRIPGRSVGVKFALERAAGKSAADLIAAIERLYDEQQARYFLIDASAEILTQVAQGVKDKDLLLFNVSEMADELRAQECHPLLMHTVPSYGMLSDALVQYIVAKKWREVLMLVGPLPEDAALARAFERSAKRLGAEVVESKEFVLSNDPRQRDQTNVALLTGNEDYDVVFLADSDGEFGRYVPYQTQRPRPVIGTEGLSADGWHHYWERHGAPQLNQRFEKRAERHMTSTDWAAWVAIKAIVESVLRTKSTDFEEISSYLRGDRITLDGYKGNPSSFRPWDNQLRQPILLHTHNAVLGRAPITGFLHATNNLDTLGFDKPETECEF